MYVNITYRRVEVSNKASKVDGIYILTYIHCISLNCFWYSGRRTQKASETCRAILQLQINILPSCITLVLLYILTYDAQKPKHNINGRELAAASQTEVTSARAPR